MDAVSIVEDEVRELIRRRGVDPSRDSGDVRRLVEEAVADYDSRSMSGGLPPLHDATAAIKSVLDVVAGFGPLQQHLDDPRVEESRLYPPYGRDGSAPGHVQVSAGPVLPEPGRDKGGAFFTSD